MIAQPLLVEYVWPRDLYPRTSTVSTIVFFDAVVLRRIGLYTCAAFTLILEAIRMYIAKATIKRSRIAAKILLWGPRILYDTFFVAIIYQAAKTILRFSCTPTISCGDAFGNSFTCSASRGQLILVNGTKRAIVQYDPFIEFDVYVAVIVLLLTFAGSLRYVTDEKNSRNPSFRYLPIFNAIYFGMRAVAAATGAVFKYYPFPCLVFYWMFYASALILNWWLAPCQGRGLGANNIRSASLAGGLYVTTYGIGYFYSADTSDPSVSITFIMSLFGGCILIMVAICC